MIRPTFTWRTSLLASLVLLLSVPLAVELGAESRAQVRLVRLLEEVPDGERKTVGDVHDLRLRLERGNILLLRKGGESAALLPIESMSNGRDSLRYFYYIENSPFLWLFPGRKDKGIATVGDGGSIRINTFDLKWRARKGELGWIYFPDDPANRKVRFSVVSGRTVDEADPMDTKYWIELGPAEGSGF